MSATMQNIQVFRKYPLSGTRERGYFPGCQESQEDPAKRYESGYRFLKTVFTVKKAASVLPLFTGDNYEYLYQTALNYSKLVNISLQPPKDNSIQSLFDYMNGLLEDRQNMTIVEDDGLVSFYVYYDTDFFLNKRYYIPCSILHRTKGRFKKIITNLLLCLKLHGATSLLNEWDYLRFTEECEYHIKHEVKENDLSQDDKKLQLLYEGCKEDGEIDRLFKLLEKEECDLETLKKSIKNYRPANSDERKVISLIKRGMSLLERGNIHSYINEAYEQMYENRELDEDGNWDDDGYEIITLDQLFRFVYDTDDKLTESLEEGFLSSYYNSSFEVFVDYIPSTEIVPTPITDIPLQPRYPELFFWWLEELIITLDKYGRNELVILLENYEKEN